MQKKVTLTRASLLILVILLAASVIFNVVQLSAAESETPSALRGTYGRNETDTRGTELYYVFDGEGNYCKYTQKDGLLEEGRYTEDAPRQVTLAGNSGTTEKVVLEADGIFCAAYDGELSVLFYPRFSEVPTYIGEWAADRRL